MIKSHFSFPLVIARRCVTLVVIALCTSSAAAEPQIKNLSLRGVQTGAATVLTIDGEGLGPDATVFLGAPIERQTIKPGASDKRIEIELALGDKVQGGLYLLRVVTPAGVSNSVPIGIDALPQLPMSDRVNTFPVALSGSIAGDQSAKTTFVGKKGEAITIEVEARRLLSQLNPVVHLYDARRVQIAWAQGSKLPAGDVRLTAKLPADGEYTVELHDALYQARSPGNFRLKIGQFAYADLAYPSAVKQGTTTAVQLVGGNLATNATGDVTAPARAEFFAPPSIADTPLTGSRPALFASEFEQVVESTALSQLRAPIGIHGRLASPGEEDRYRVAVEPDQKLMVDVHALRLGSPLDGVVTVYDASGNNLLATNDDRPGMADPGLDFTVPAGANEIVVGIKDLLGRAGDGFVYRITLAPQGRPDFSLSLSEDKVSVPRGGRSLVKIGVERRGYAGPIDLLFEGLPPGITVENAQIPAASNIGLVVLAGVGDAPALGIVQVVGRAVSSDGSTGGELSRIALLPANALTERQAWMRQEVAVALAKPAALELAWAPESSSLPLGAKLTGKAKATRREGSTGAVRLSLVTSQQTPRKTIKENNIDKQVDDVERTLRLDGAPMIAADQGDTTAGVIIPADLPEASYSLVLRGELLAADGKQVLATTYAPVISAQPSRPVALELTGAKEIEARAGLGETGRFSGKIVRQAGFNHPVRVTLSGLPAGVPAPFEDLPADKSEFELSVRLPHGMKPEPLKNVQLVAVSLASPGDLDSAVRTNTVPVTLNVASGDKPPSEPPLRIFEDEEEFTMRLDQGGGQIRLEGGEKYSGSASARVTPDQRFNPTLPGLGVKIRKDPGPGEYRYLRFVWKKQGGNQVCLQLNHDGQWGPTPNGNGTKFRYHAGPGDCYGASLRVAPRVPNRLTAVTRDLYADFGEFTLMGLALSPIDGQFAVFDHIYLGRSVDDLDSVKPEK